MVKEAAADIPDGIPKSGRIWKVKQTFRSSVQQRSGFLSTLNKSFEEKEKIRAKKQAVLLLERQLKDDKKQKFELEKQKREERQKRRIENEYKNSKFQVINPEKLKGMSKKQLRMVRKTSMNKNGQVELVNPYAK